VRVTSAVAKPAVIGLSIKMFFVPALVLALAWSLGSVGERAWEASILESAMPPMVTAGVVAVGAGMDEDLVAFMVGIGTLISFLSVPLLSLAL
jgi:predicted permease